MSTSSAPVQPHAKPARKAAKRSAKQRIQRFTGLFVFISIGSILVHHLVSERNFPLSPGYEFPFWQVAISIPLSLLLFYSIDELFHRYYADGSRSLAQFMAITEGLLIAVPGGAHLVVVAATGQNFELFPFLQGMGINVLSGTLWVVLFYVRSWTFISIQPPTAVSDKILIESGSQKRSVAIETIAFFFIENQIVYTVLKDGTRFTADQKLADLENMLQEHRFFRVNRQFLISHDAVQSIKKDVNQKLLVQVEPADQVKAPITVSRYKNKEFQSWVSGPVLTDHSGD